MAGDHHYLVGDAAVGHGDAGDGGRGEGGSDAGDDRDRHAGFGTGDDLFEAASENVRIAAFQPYDELPGQRVLDQGAVDEVLRGRAAVRDLGRVDDLHLGRQVVQQFAGSETVGDDDVR